MDHPSNSRLCVLSGTHAGASLDLAPGDYTVGCEDDSSIYLSDWAFAPLTLRVDPNGDHEVRWVGRRVVTISMPSFKAFDFAGTVLSIGAADGDWPERADVMETRKQVRLNPGFLPAVHRPVTRARRSLLSVFGAGLVGAFLIGGLVSALSKQQPSFPSAPQSRQKFVQEVVDAVAPSALRVTVSGNSLTVDGVVSDAEVARRVHDRLVGMRLPMALVERYVPAGSLVQIIRTAPGLNDAEINFVGSSRFAIVAKAEEAMNARASVAQLQVELKPAVRELELKFASPPQEEPQKTNDDLMRSAWSPAEGLHVAETRDGVKYMLLEQTDAAPETEIVEPSPKKKTRR